MNTDVLEFEFTMGKSQVVGLREIIDAAAVRNIVATLTDNQGNSAKYAVRPANELEDATENACLLFLMRDGNIYQGYLKSIEEDDNMILVKPVTTKYTFGLPISGLFGWIDMSQPINE